MDRRKRMEVIGSWIETHLDEMLEDMSALIRIDSARTDAEPGMPYGRGPAAALDAAASLLERHGLRVGRVGDVVVTGDLNDCDRQLDILAHLDVVPGGPDWTVCGPFEPVVRDGRLYGRGAADDKGPAVAALYAMRAVREAGVPLKRNVRLILGSDEECGSSDIAVYYAQEKEAPMTFSPDAEWPLVNTEKGLLQYSYGRTFEPAAALPRVLKISAGTKANVVPGRATAWVQGLAVDALERLAASMGEAAEGVTFAFAVTDELAKEFADASAPVVRIDARGVPCHASLPEKGSNALTALISLLAALPCAPSDAFDAILAIRAAHPHGDNDGTALGVRMADVVSGALTSAFSMLALTPSGVRATVDSRVPVVGSEKPIRDAIESKLRPAGLAIEAWRYNPPHHVDADSHFVRTLLDCHGDVTGSRGEPMAIGGGTYVHNLKSGVAFGCADLEVDNRMHGPDEFMEISQIVASTRIFAEAIIRLCGE